MSIKFFFFNMMYYKIKICLLIFVITNSIMKLVGNINSTTIVIIDNIIIENIDLYILHLFIVPFSVFDNDIKLYDGFSIMNTTSTIFVLSH